MVARSFAIDRVALGGELVGHGGDVRRGRVDRAVGQQFVELHHTQLLTTGNPSTSTAAADVFPAGTCNTFLSRSLDRGLFRAGPPRWGG
jgi:hypothetical protein